MSLRQVTIGSAAMGSIGILRLLTQFFLLPVLARYLTPADYGVVAIAMPFVLFGMMFSDAGISSSLIRSSSKNTIEWSTSFWLTIIMGFCLTLTLVGLGYLISLFLAQPSLFPIIGTLSLIIFLQSIAAVPGASLQQSHRFTMIAGIEIVSMFTSLTATYLAAKHGWGAWALVAQQIVQFSVRVILTLIISRFRPYLVFSIRDILTHLTFGRDMLGNNIIAFSRQCLTNTIIGKSLGPSAMGIFTMGALFSELPGRVVTGPIQLVVYPRMSKLSDDKEAIRGLFLFLSRIIAILAVPVIGMVAVSHQAIFTIMLSEKWQQAGYIFMILAPATALQAVSGLRGTIAMSLGRTDIVIRQSFELSVLTILALLIAVYYGIEAVALAVTLVSIFYTPRALLQSFKLIELPFRKFLSVICLPFVTTMISITIYLAINTGIEISDWEAFSIAFFLGLFSFMASLYFQFSGIKNEIEAVKKSLEQSISPT